MAGIVMYLLREGSRNAINNDRNEANFSKNYQKVFKLRLPHMDTVDEFFRHLPPEETEKIKAELIAELIKRKVFNTYRLCGKYHCVAIDGTGVCSYHKNNVEGTRISRTSKNGKTVFHDYVLEAKFVTSTGLCISIASEWVTNKGKNTYDKQDCELKAFVRLAKKVKTLFPQLPICILADGLYPNQTFMQTCKNYSWEYIVVLKDDQLKTLHEDIADIDNKHRFHSEFHTTEGKGLIHTEQQYDWISEELYYCGHALYYMKCIETVTRYSNPVNKTGSHQKNNSESTLLNKKAEQPLKRNFVWISSIAVTQANVRRLAEAGRNRWQIENEGFNAQKNLGYSLGHKFARASNDSMMNFYQCLQTAHFISQMVEHSTTIMEELCRNTKLTIIHYWKQAKRWLTQKDDIELQDMTERRMQIRLR